VVIGSMVVLSIFKSHFQLRLYLSTFDGDAHTVKLRRRAIAGPSDEGIDQYLRIDPAAG
jgi:hypothetical protein